MEKLCARIFRPAGGMAYGVAPEEQGRTPCFGKRDVVTNRVCPEWHCREFVGFCAHKKHPHDPFNFLGPNATDSGPPWPMLYVTSLALLPKF